MRPRKASSQIPASVLKLLEQATPSDVRFIKLGRKSVWWPLAKDTNTIRLGFKQFDFELCRDGKWDAAERRFAKITSRKRASDITRAVKQVRQFFELPERTLWTTIEDGDVWWCFADATVKDIYSGNDLSAETEGARLRKIIDRWRNTDVNRERLRLDTMTTKITKVASFQETICKPSGAAEILRRIQCQNSESHKRTSDALKRMTVEVGDLLDQLHQKDFELLIELIFSSSGWQRVSALGGTQKTLDIALRLPTTGESCFVQVKSQTNQSTFKNLVDQLDNYSGYSKMFFVYHTPAQRFDNSDIERVVIWSRYDVAERLIGAGLVQWLLARTT